MTLDQLPAIRALDLFAGTGWGVACQALGIDEYGVELMAEAVATRRAAGMRTVFYDVWDGLDGTAFAPAHDLQIASPPCQTFSMAGKGSGRQALEAVLELIATGAYRQPGVLREWGPKLGHDERTALVLAPLAYAYRDRPRLIVWEQVPTVLPVWEAAAVELRGLGYSVAVEILHAERYGVPQTRKRAILVARRDGIEASMPPATHSAYYVRDPKRMDPGVLPWVSMIDALGWGMTARPAPTQTGHGIATRQASGQQQVYRDAIAADAFVFRPPYTAETARRSDDPISLSRAFHPEAVNCSIEEASLLQSFPGVRPEVAAWPQSDRPATVIQGDPRIPLRKHHSVESRQMDGALRVTRDEASVLQSYPHPFPWQGKTTRSQFLQIGNAVPPLLARAILAHVTREA